MILMPGDLLDQLQAAHGAEVWPGDHRGFILLQEVQVLESPN